MKKYLRLNRRLIPVNAAIIAGTLIFGACAAESTTSVAANPPVTTAPDRTPTPTTTAPHSGWSASDLAVARAAYFALDAYGAPDPFGECTFAYIVSNYTPDEVSSLTESGTRTVIAAASVECIDAL